jgi:hypothetical protein
MWWLYEQYKNRFAKINGVENVNIDKDTETVTIDGTVEKTILTNALSKMGYPEKGIMIY